MTMENYFQMQLTLAQVNAISNVGLAHIGDGVYELLVGPICAHRERKPSEICTNSQWSW